MNLQLSSTCFGLLEPSSGYFMNLQPSSTCFGLLEPSSGCCSLIKYPQRFIICIIFICSVISYASSSVSFLFCLVLCFFLNFSSIKEQTNKKQKAPYGKINSKLEAEHPTLLTARGFSVSGGPKVLFFRTYFNNIIRIYFLILIQKVRSRLH